MSYYYKAVDFFAIDCQSYLRFKQCETFSSSSMRCCSQ